MPYRGIELLYMSHSEVIKNEHEKNESSLQVGFGIAHLATKARKVRNLADPRNQRRPDWTKIMFRQINRVEQ